MSTNVQISINPNVQNFSNPKITLNVYSQIIQAAAHARKFLKYYIQEFGCKISIFLARIILNFRILIILLSYYYICITLEKKKMLG